MKLLVRVRPENGHFVASLHGDEVVRAVGSSRDSAISSLMGELDQKTFGELVEVEWAPKGIHALGGTYSGVAAELLQDIVAEAYRLRDEQKKTEFPE